MATTVTLTPEQEQEIYEKVTRAQRGAKQFPYVVVVDLNEVEFDCLQAIAGHEITIPRLAVDAKIVPEAHRRDASEALRKLHIALVAAHSRRV